MSKSLKIYRVTDTQDTDEPAPLVVAFSFDEAVQIIQDCVGNPVVSVELIAEQEGVSDKFAALFVNEAVGNAIEKDAA